MAHTEVPITLAVSPWLLEAVGRRAGDVGGSDRPAVIARDLERYYWLVSDGAERARAQLDEGDWDLVLAAVRGAAPELALATLLRSFPGVVRTCGTGAPEDRLRVADVVAGWGSLEKVGVLDAASRWS